MGRLIDDIVTYLKVDRACALKAVRTFHKTRATYAEDYGGHESFAIVEGLKSAGAVLAEGGFRHSGVEGNCGQSFQDDYRNPPDEGESVVEYLNAGDTYAATLVYDYHYRGGGLRVTTWGDVIEACDVRYGRIYES